MPRLHLAAPKVSHIPTFFVMVIEKNKFLHKQKRLKNKLYFSFVWKLGYIALMESLENYKQTKLQHSRRCMREEWVSFFCFLFFRTAMKCLTILSATAKQNAHKELRKIVHCIPVCTILAKNTKINFAIVMSVVMHSRTATKHVLSEFVQEFSFLRAFQIWWKLFGI